jgi:hypothetical protein
VAPQGTSHRRRSCAWPTSFGSTAGHRCERRFETMADSNEPASKMDISNAVGWILGGFTLVSGGIGALTLAPRVVGTYKWPVIIAVGVMIAAFIFAGNAARMSLAKSDHPSATKIHWHVVIGFILLMASVGVLLILVCLTLGKGEFPRLALTVVENQKPNGELEPADTVKLKYEADGLHPAQPVVVNIMALPQVNDGQEIHSVEADRIYSATIGSDGTGKVVSEIETEIDRGKYAVVVAEVYPLPEKQSQGCDNELNCTPTNPTDSVDECPVHPDKCLPRTKWADEKDAHTFLCGDIVADSKRSCAWAIVPGDGPEVSPGPLSSPTAPSPAQP